MNEYNGIKVGDLVQSTRIPTLIGRVEEVREGGSGIVVVGYRRVFAVLDYWTKIKDGNGG